MLIVSKKGKYKLDSNYRDAFVLEAFESKYIEECFDRYTYIVGDISSGILRLKGFDTNPQSKNYYGFIEDYLAFSCPLGCPYYILKRIKSDGEFAKEQNKNTPVKSEGFSITPITKESFDKENIILETSKKNRPDIKIDSEKINSIPKGNVSEEIKEFITQDSMNNNNNRNSKKEEKEEQTTQSYVSSSPGFVPNQNNNRRYNGNRNRNKKKAN